MEPFEVGNLWEHKLQHSRIFIREAYENEDGQTVFFVGRIPDKARGETPFDRDFLDFVVTKRTWTAEELIQNYTPLWRNARPTVWDHLALGLLDDVGLE